MKKKLQAILIFALVTFLIVAISPFADSQESTISGTKIDGIPVVISGETLFTIQVSSGSFSPEERVQAIRHRIEAIAKDPTMKLDQLMIDDQADTTSIVLDKQVIITLTEADAKAARENRQKLATDYQQKIKSIVEEYRNSRKPTALLFGGLYTILCTLTLIIIFFILNKIFPVIYNRLNIWRTTRISSLRIQNIELIPANQITDVLISFVKLVRFIIVLTILYIYIPLVLSFFPWTKPLGDNLFNYLLAAINTAWEAIVNYFPNLFFIALIVVIAYYIIRLIKPVFNEIDRGHISFPGFYQDWARPTYKLTLFFIVALATVIAFPYLPGSSSPAFRGVSLFLGVLFSLGSTSAVANMVGGIILIYTRAFQLGDRVQIDSAVGDIVEKTLLVTRIRTIKNVVITIPNAKVLNSNVVNYSASVRDNDQLPLILHTTITLGYDVPWRQVYQVLINAAKATDYILAEPVPFVLQTNLDDFYVSYELNAYTNRPAIMARIYSQLHQNIQDKCNEEGIEIMSPHYSAIRDGHQNTIPEDYLSKDYTPPGLRIDSLSNQSNLSNQQNLSNDQQ